MSQKREEIFDILVSAGLTYTGANVTLERIMAVVEKNAWRMVKDNQPPEGVWSGWIITPGGSVFYSDDVNQFVTVFYKDWSRILEYRMEMIQ